MPARANKAGIDAGDPVPLSAVWIARLAHCAGKSASSQPGSAPGTAAAVNKIAASPATTNRAMSHPLSDKLVANRAPRAAKLTLAMIHANPVDAGCSRGGMPSACAKTIRQVPLSSAKMTPIHKRPAMAAAINPAPIRPKANIGPLAKASVEDVAGSNTIASTGAATPASAAVNQGRKRQVGGVVRVKRFIATILTERSRVVDRKLKRGELDIAAAYQSCVSVATRACSPSKVMI